MLIWRSVRGRAMLAGAVFMLLLAAVATVAVWRARDDQESHHLLNQRLVVVGAVENARAESLRSAVLLTAAVFEEDTGPLIDASRQATEVANEELERARDRLVALGDVDEVAKVDGLVAQGAQLQQDVDGLLASAGTLDVATRIAIGQQYHAELWDVTEAQLAALEQLAERQEDQAAAERAAADRAADVTLWLLVGLSTIVFMVGAVALMMLVLSVVRPLASLRRSVRAIASGDLETRTAVSGPEEVASLARDFSEMVSERRQAEEALRQTKERFQDLYENAPNAYFSVGADGLIRRCNRPAGELLGFGVGELVGQPVLQLYAQTPHGRAKARKVLERFRAGEKIRDEELQMQKADGTPVWISLTVNALRDDSGQVDESRSMVVDITERKRAEEALRASEAQYQELIENANDIMFTIGLDGRFTSLNKVGEEVTGYTRAGAPTVNLAEIVAPEHLERAREMIQRKVAGGGPTRYELDIIARDGRRVPLEVSTRLVYEGEKPIGIQGIARDITERKRAEEALRESEEKARAVTDAAGDGIITLDADGKILCWNPASERLFGYTSEEAIGKDIHSLIVPEEYHSVCQKGLRRFKATGQGPVIGKTLEVSAMKSDGTEFPVELSISAVRLGGKWSAVGIVRDITERKRMEEALREQARRDLLTGALNHGAIVGELRSLLSESDGGSTHALAMVDVDGLKAINDTYGHQVGDAVLVTVAGALSRDGATVGRYGGDEFVAILPGADRLAAQRYRDAVLDSLAYANLTDPESGAHVPVVVSIGLVVYPTEAARVEELIKLADSEMYAVKRQRPVGSTGMTLPQALGSERAAKTVGELVPLLTSPGDVDEKLRLAAHRLSIGAGCDVVHFSMFPPEPGGATVSQSFGRLPAELVEAWDDNVRSEWELPHPLRLLVERARRPVILEDLRHDDRIPAHQRELLHAAGLRSGLVVPLLLQDTAVGVLAVGSRREAAFGPNEAQFFMAVATQVAGIARMATLVDELRSASDRLAEARIETVLLLAAAAEAHDQTTGLHLQRVRAITEALARELGYSEEDARDLGVASVLHDIGKVRVPDSVLSNVSGLSGEEWELLKRHTVWGEELLQGRPGFELATTIARSHHERWDGSGYPDGLAGEAIPEAATIVAVADAFDAMTSGRPYKTARSVASAVREIAKWSGSQFSPKVVRALARLRRRGTLPPTPGEPADQKAAA